MVWTKVYKNILGQDEYEYIISYKYSEADLIEELKDVDDEIAILDPSGRPDMPPENKIRVRRLTRTRNQLIKSLDKIDSQRQKDASISGDAD